MQEYKLVYMRTVSGRTFKLKATVAVACQAYVCLYVFLLKETRLNVMIMSLDVHVDIIILLTTLNFTITPVSVYAHFINGKYCVI